MKSSIDHSFTWIKKQEDEIQDTMKGYCDEDEDDDDRNQET